MKKARKLSIYVGILVLVLLFTIVTPISATANSSLELYSLAYVKVDTFLNLRLEPQGEIIGQIPNNAVVTILSQRDRNGYYKIQVNKTNEVGYVYGEYLSAYYYFDDNDVSYAELFRPTPTPSPSPTPIPTIKEIRTISTSDGFSLVEDTLVVLSQYKLNFRSNPSINGERIKYLLGGNKLQLLSYTVSDNYILVKEISTGLTGYVDYRYVGYKEGVSVKRLTVTDVYTPETTPTYGCCQYCQCNCQCHQW